MNAADVHLRYEEERRADLIQAARQRELANTFADAGEPRGRRLTARLQSALRVRLHFPGAPGVLHR